MRMILHLLTTILFNRINSPAFTDTNIKTAADFYFKAESELSVYRKRSNFTFKYVDSNNTNPRLKEYGNSTSSDKEDGSKDSNETPDYNNPFNIYIFCNDVKIDIDNNENNDSNDTKEITNNTDEIPSEENENEECPESSKDSNNSSEGDNNTSWEDNIDNFMNNVNLNIKNIINEVVYDPDLDEAHKKLLEDKGKEMSQESEDDSQNSNETDNKIEEDVDKDLNKNCNEIEKTEEEDLNKYNANQFWYISPELPLDPEIVASTSRSNDNDKLADISDTFLVS